MRDTCILLVIIIDRYLLPVGVIKQYYPGATWKNGSAVYLDGYDWQAIPVYNSSVDPQKYGSSNGLPRRLIIGGAWVYSSLCGSRCIHCNDLSSLVHGYFGTRWCIYAILCLQNLGWLTSHTLTHSNSNLGSLPQF